MTRQHALPIGITVACVMLATTAAAQSLADVARQERARRAGIAAEDKAKVYTNNDLRGAGRLTTGSSREVVPRGDASAEAAPDLERSEELANAETGGGREAGETAWRERITAAREARDRAELMSSALQNRVDGLWAQFAAMDDPAQRALVEQQRVEALTELENLDAEIERLDENIREIEEEARRSNVPPGWLR